MAAYMICTMRVHDPEAYTKYTALTPATLKRYGGRFLTRGDQVTTCEGETFTDRMVILEFPDEATAIPALPTPVAPRTATVRRATKSCATSPKTPTAPASARSPRLSRCAATTASG